MGGFFSLVTDLLLLSASLGAAAYCMVLSRKLANLGSFDKGIGNAIAVLSAQVDEMKMALGEAKAGTDSAEQNLSDLVRQAQDISAELEMMIAACHDFAETAIQVQNDGPVGSKTPSLEAMADAALSGDPNSTPNGGLGNTQGSTNGGAVPMFGSRRTAPDGDDATVPMFRSRSGSVGA